MRTTFRKSVTSLTALLLMAGGFLPFTTERMNAAGTRTIYVGQNAWYVANLCIKNRSKFNHTVCTGKVPINSVRDLTFPWDPGDRLVFIVAVVAGHNAYVESISDRNTNCWSGGSSLAPRARCANKFPWKS